MCTGNEKAAKATRRWLFLAVSWQSAFSVAGSFTVPLWSLQESSAEAGDVGWTNREICRTLNRMGVRNALFVALAVTGVVTAQSTPEVAARADAYIKAAGIQGSVLLAKSGKVILAKGYGLANIELDVANRPETKFRLGSITKQFTAVAILQLQENGKLGVNDPISKY